MIHFLSQNPWREVRYYIVYFMIFLSAENVLSFLGFPSEVSSHWGRVGSSPRVVGVSVIQFFMCARKVETRESSKHWTFPEMCMEIGENSFYMEIGFFLHRLVLLFCHSEMNHHPHYHKNRAPCRLTFCILIKNWELSFPFVQRHFHYFLSLHYRVNHSRRCWAHCKPQVGSTKAVSGSLFRLSLIDTDNPQIRKITFNLISINIFTFCRRDCWCWTNFYFTSLATRHKFYIPEAINSDVRDFSHLTTFTGHSLALNCVFRFYDFSSFSLVCHEQKQIVLSRFFTVYIRALR